MATELQQLGTFLGNKFDDIYDGVVAVGDAALLNGQTSQQIKDTVTNLLRDGVVAEGDTLFKVNQKISALQTLVASDDVNLDTVQEVVNYIKDNKDLIDSMSTLKANVADVYTQLQINDFLSLKADDNLVYKKSETYTRSEVDAKDSLKADTTTVNNALATKVNIVSVDGTINDITNKVATEDTIATAIAGKADTSTVDAQLATKATIVYTDAQLALKSDITYTDSQDALKVDIVSVDGTIDNDNNKIPTQNVVDSTIATAIAPKAAKTYVDSQDALKVNYTDTVSAVSSDNKVVTETELTAGLSLKADQATTYTKTEVDAIKSNLNTADANLQGQITQIGSYADFVGAFDATLVE